MSEMTRMVTKLTTARINRTGLAASPIDGPEMVRIAEESPVASPNRQRLTTVRELYAKEAEPIGTVPPPATLKGLTQDMAKMLRGEQPFLLIDKLAERLAFERTGTRLYQGLVDKFDALGGFEGGQNGAS